jgi:Cu(I)/Ag(I) efflux system membrane fusion protein
MKNTKWMVSIVLTLLLGGAVFGVTGCNSSEPSNSGAAGGAQTKQYTCSMHPDVVQNSPGKCPKCGMELTEKK